MRARPLFRSGLAMVLAAMAAWGCAPGAGDGGGAARAGRPARDHVRRCLNLIASDLEGLKGTFPELADLAEEAVTDAGLEYVCRGQAVSGTTPEDAGLGAGGCRVWVSVQPQGGAWRGSRHEFPSLGLEARYEVAMGSTGEDRRKAFVRKVQEVIAARLTPLRDLDQVAGTCLKGIAADLGAIKDKYPALADWKPEALKGNRIHYVNAASGQTIDVEVRLGPSQVKSDCDYPFYVSTALGAGASPGLDGEIRAIVQKNLQPLREFDRSTGGWLTR
jgi:hypothetical protein